MDAQQQIFLEQTYGELAEAEERLKQLGQFIESYNEEIKQLRLLRDAYKEEKNALIERCKELAIGVQAITASENNEKKA